MLFAKLWNSNGHRSDGDLAAEIHKALRGYAPLYATAPPIQVEVSDGVATLRGVVRGVALRYAAGRLATTVPGVEAVRNELLDDPAIERAVAQALATHPSVRLLTDAVRVKSYHGEVTLTGHIPSQTQQMAAEAVVRGVPGVSDVVNALIVISGGNGQRY